MNKAFLFDMDGVLINSELVWDKYGRDFAEGVFGRDILDKIGDTTGSTLAMLYEKAVEYGFTKGRDEVFKAYDGFMQSIYDKTTLVPGLEEFIQYLKKNDYKVGIVSSSRRLWIEMVLQKIPYRDQFDLIFSLDEKNLPSKPSPEGYKEAMKELQTTPETTIILEDSNAGIASGKNSGAFTIAFTQFLVEGYPQVEANAKAGTLAEVKEIIEENFLG